MLVICILECDTEFYFLNLMSYSLCVLFSTQIKQYHYMNLISLCTLLFFNIQIHNIIISNKIVIECYLLGFDV